ncbi:hypothetical protein PIB30_107627, partial [Stylosanthes scabra]|nr:hypothetical protein [Stylosanthes scabra]
KKIRIEGHVFDIEYENLHLICEKCSCYGHDTSNCSEQVQPKENLVQHPDIEVPAVHTEPNESKAPSSDKESSEKKVSEAVHQQQAPEITTFATNPTEKTFEFGKTKGVLTDVVAKEQNWTEVTRKPKTKQGGQPGKQKTIPSTTQNKKLGQVGRRATPLNIHASTHANTPSKFAIRKRQRSSSAQSSPELRQITSAKASSSGTKDDETIQEVARKDAPVVTEDPPKSHMQT